MATSTLTRDALMPRQPAGMGKGLVLALMAHALLVVALAFSVRWKTSNPAGVEAELWAAVPQIAAPRAVAPEPVPVPPVVKPAPAPPPPPKVEPAPAPAPDAQIAVEKAKRDEAKREQKRLEDEKREAELREKAKDEQLRAKEELERKKKEAAKQKQEEEKLAAAREANLKRILGQAGASGEPSSTGTAAKSAGPSAGYAGRIKARVQPNIVFAESVSGNPLATVEVRLAPDGTITSRRLTKSSGVRAWDEAVLRAIDKTEVLPRDTDGRVPPVIEIDFRPYD